MRESKYNIDISENVIYNSLYGTLIELDDETAQACKKILSGKKLNCEEQNIEMQLHTQGIIVDDETNELDILKNRFMRGKYSNDKVNITIIPSYLCNFSCIYCYQEANVDCMSKKVQDDVIEFIRNITQTSRELNITWFGGEPLLHFDIIEKLSCEIQKYCTRMKINYTAGIVTNGYLLTNSIISKMKQLCIHNAQITIDGPPNIHNQRRMLIKGGETFDRCIDAIRRLTEEEIYVNIRVNVDRTNYNTVDELLEYFSSLKKEKYSIDIQKVTEFTEKCSCFTEKCFERSEYLKLSTALYKKIAERKLYNEPNIFLPEAVFAFCIAHNVMSYVISPNGDLYKCLCDTENPSRKVGNIDEYIEGCDLNLIERFYHLNDPFSDKRCLDCNLLPLCMGGCPRGASEGKRECFASRENLVKMVNIFLEEVSTTN